MKTRNVFDLTAANVTMKVYDLTGYQKGDDTKDAPLLAEHVFDVEAIPALLEDGEQVAKSLAAYGLSRLMQDRCSDYTDNKMEGTAQEVADMRLAAYQAVYDVLASGQFRARREAKGKAAAVDVFFAKGLVKFLAEQGKEMDEGAATIFLQQQSGDARKALRAKLADYIAEARKEAQDAAASIDISELL